MALIIPKQYKLKLLPETTEQAIKTLKVSFQENCLNIKPSSGNSTFVCISLEQVSMTILMGMRGLLHFPIKCMGDRKAEVVHSLAKWKRLKLGAYGIAPGYGLYTEHECDPFG